MDYKALALKAGNLLNNYSHVAAGGSLAAVLTVYHLKTGKDLGPNYVTFAAYFYGFLLGHAGVYQKWPDRPADSSGS